MENNSITPHHDNNNNKLSNAELIKLIETFINNSYEEGFSETPIGLFLNEWSEAVNGDLFACDYCLDESTVDAFIRYIINEMEYFITDIRTMILKILVVSLQQNGIERIMTRVCKN